MAAHTRNATATSAAAMMRCVTTYPNQSTNLGVKKADRAVPPMPAPKTPVANPRRSASNHAFANGMPTAKVVPPIPRKKPKSSIRP